MALISAWFTFVPSPDPDGSVNFSSFLLNTTTTSRPIVILYYSQSSQRSINRRRLTDTRDFARDQKTLDWLLDQGVDINRTDVQRLDDGFNLAPGETDWSLHLLNKVAADGDIALFDYLVSRGADVTLSTALHSASACESPELSRAMVCHLLDKYSMDINSNNDNFRDFIHDADDSGSPLCSAIINQNLGVVNELLQRGVLPTEPDSYPASYAAKLFLPALEPLLHAGADPSEALRDAVAYSNVGAAKVCIGFGADPGPALQEALKKEERRGRSAADAAAFIECTSDMDDEDYEKTHEEERVVEENNKAMAALLRSAMESDSAAGIARPQ